MADKKKRRIWRWLILIPMFCGLFGQHQVRAPKRNFSDFHVPYTVGTNILKGEEIYSYTNNVSYFKYPPFYANLVAPLTVFSEHTASNIWFILSFIFTMIFYHTSRKIIVEEDGYDPLLLYSLTFWVTFRAMLQNMQQGQANVFMITLLIVGLYYFTQKKNVLGAFFVSFSIMTKYMTIFFLLYFLFIGQIGFLLLVGLFILFFNFVPAMAFGWDRAALLVQQQLAFLFESSLDPWSIYCHPNQSLLAFLARTFWEESIYPIHIMQVDKKMLYLIFFAVGGFLYLLAATPTRQIQKKIPDEKKVFARNVDWALIFIVMTLLNPNGWANFFVCLIFPYMFIIHYLIKCRWKDNWVFFFALLAFASSSWPSSEVIGDQNADTFEMFSSVTIGAFFLFIAIFTLKLRLIFNSERK